MLSQGGSHAKALSSLWTQASTRIPSDSWPLNYWPARLEPAWPVYIRRRKSFDGRGRLNLARNSFSNSPKGWLQPIPSNALQAPRVGEGVGRRAEEENWIIARGNAIRHYKGVVIDPVAARLGRRCCRRDCERSRLEFSATGGPQNRRVVLRIARLADGQDHVPTRRPLF